MLTDKEREWLTVRKKACARCGNTPSRCSQDQRNACYRAGFPLWDKTTVTFCSLRDAAEFEARVSRYIAENASELDFSSNNWQFFDGFKAKSLAWYVLREARIAVEEEMDNE